MQSLGRGGNDMLERRVNGCFIAGCLVLLIVVLALAALNVGVGLW